MLEADVVRVLGELMAHEVTQKDVIELVREIDCLLFETEKAITEYFKCRKDGTSSNGLNRSQVN